MRVQSTVTPPHFAPQSIYLFRQIMTINNDNFTIRGSHSGADEHYTWPHDVFPRQH